MFKLGIIGLFLIIGLMIIPVNFVSAQMGDNSFVSTDRSNYQAGDIVHITGIFPTGNLAYVKILNPNGFSTTGGWQSALMDPYDYTFDISFDTAGSGWGQTGTYVVKTMNQGQDLFEQTTFYLKTSDEYPKPVTTNTITTVDESGFSQDCMISGCYTPTVAIVNIGGVVTMANTDPTGVHTFTSGTVNGFTPSPDGIFDTSILGPGDAFEWTPTQAGEVPYYCMLHTWMVGTIIVQGSALVVAPTPEPVLQSDVKLNVDKYSYESVEDQSAWKEAAQDARVNLNGLMTIIQESCSDFDEMFSSVPDFKSLIAKNHVEEAKISAKYVCDEVGVIKSNVDLGIQLEIDGKYLDAFEVYRDYLSSSGDSLKSKSLSLMDSINLANSAENEFQKQKAQEAQIAQLEAEQNGGGCLIATATYGSEMSQQVQQLRELRDNQLLQTESGTAFMSTFNDIYYSFSPTIADMEREHPLFKEAVKLAITPMISTLSLMENANSESEVLSIGISVIMLNLGMYLGVPAIVVIGIRKRI